MSEAVADGVAARLSALAAALRAGGVRVGVGELLAAHRALQAVDPASRGQVRRALRAVLCSRREDLAVFAAAFEGVFGGAAGGELAIDPVAAEALPSAPGGSALGGDPAEASAFDPLPVAAEWSALERLRELDFADYTDEERRLARALLRRLAARPAQRPSRRTRPARRRARRHDPRATLRASLRHDGEPLELRYRAASPRPRPLVLVCDVSGSMEPYARVLLGYLQACVAARRRVEAFVFATRLTRVTRELAGADPDRALARAAAAVGDWSGGTRIGDALATLNREHGRRLGRGADVVLLTDGWDRGDPDALGAEMARLRRCSHRLIWLNPLKARPGYEPRTRGARAALPHADVFTAGHSIASLEELVALLEDEAGT